MCWRSAAPSIRSVAAGFSATRQQDPSGALAPVPSNNAFLYNLFTPQVSVSYVPDVFGLNRRTVEVAAGAGAGGALPDDRDATSR